MAHHAAIDLPPDRSITLRDGRTLGYVEVGDPQGHPVISNHGGLSCRLDVTPSGAAATAHGLRVISPDRPGIGTSSHQADRTIGGWAADVAELADQLGLGTFSTLGWSFGGGFAQSVAFHLADRVDALSLVASGVPVDWDGMSEQINRMDQHFLTMSEHRVGRGVERTLFHLMGAAAHLAPRRVSADAGGDEADHLALAAAIAQGLHHTDGVVADYRLMDRPWGFDPSELTVPTTIWQGDADELVPPAWGQRLHDAIAGSQLRVVPGATHYLWYEHWDEIFTSLVQDRSQSEGARSEGLDARA
jgi:pimeloyl-ACP methyl ester carboxylesterase